MHTMDMLKNYHKPLTEREMAILSVCVVELEAAGYKPFTERIPIQVATWFL